MKNKSTNLSKCNVDVNEDLYIDFIVKNINFIKDRDYLTLSRLQIELSIGFNKANRILNTLIDLGLVSKTKEEKEGYKVYKNKIEALPTNDNSLKIKLKKLLAKRKSLIEQLEKL